MGTPINLPIFIRDIPLIAPSPAWREYLYGTRLHCEVFVIARCGRVPEETPGIKNSFASKLYVNEVERGQDVLLRDKKMCGSCRYTW